MPKHARLTRAVPVLRLLPARKARGKRSGRTVLGMKAILSLYRPEVDLMRNPKIARLLVLCALLASLSACGSKGPLVLLN